ncbi:MAG: glycosyl hydrolase [Planctomycetes bacterium]|nr:glycosyl hydrolase [Planctomycetota bacterium]
MKRLPIFAVCLAIASSSLYAQEPHDRTSIEPKDSEKQAPVALKPEEQVQDVAEKITASTFAALKARSIGPALMSGRIGDFAVNPNNHSEYYVAVCSGGVWKTTNNGTTFSPIFDSQGSYSIGCVEIDPSNTNVVWVGTGESNSQRSVSFGDGVYKSIDGGKTFKNMGLHESEHIGMIAIDPRNSDIVYVAAQGPLWRDGGDRGLYKTIDGGKTWQRILHINDDTGANEIHLDPRNSMVLYASTYQRRRRVWTMIDGGPGSGIHKSIDGGKTWAELTKGLPGSDKGKIGLDISPANPDVIYAVVEAKKGQSGFYRSTDRGASFQKRSSQSTSAPMYYNEIICDPHDVDRVYLCDTYLMVTEDGGKTFKNSQGRNRHVDNHALWIDPTNTAHMIVGCDGGVYESFDRTATWQYKANLPITQFYRVSVDNSKPFYFVYGGTQDNATLGGPSRSTNRSMSNEDWFVTVGGDGFETQVDYENPNIVYSQWQYGGLVRHDRLTGENTDIKPRPKPGDEPHVFNWDAPLLISPHSHTRIYFGGRRLYQSDDRGNSWKTISGDLTRGIDRNELEVMGKVQPVDAVAKHENTSFYGSTVALSESPLIEGLIYVGTDDGLIQVTENGGENWRKIDALPGVPHMSYVSCLTASRHDSDTVYATFDNHKNGDFKPYILRSTDRGQSWEAISGDLGKREIVYSIAEDHVKSELLFVGTEFGAYYTLNSGNKWLKIKGLPTISVRDIDIQRRENDLAFATFGRGFYILDDYSPLQSVTTEVLDKDAHIFPIKDALFYIPSGTSRGSQGSSYWTAANPPFGAVFTYHIKKSVETGPKMDSDATSPEYDKLREKDKTRSASVFLTIRDVDGQIVNRINGSTGKGVHRTSWNLRMRGAGRRGGPPVLPGTYTVTISKQVNGEITDLTEPEPFNIVPLARGTFQPEDQAEINAFHKKVVKLYSAVQAAGKALSEAQDQITGIAKAVFNTPDADQTLAHEAHELNNRLKDISLALNGDNLPSRYQEPTLPGIRGQVQFAVSSWNMTAPPTQTQRDAYEYAASEFGEVLEQLRNLIDADLKALHSKLDAAGVNWTPGRLPVWNKE